MGAGLDDDLRALHGSPDELYRALVSRAGGQGSPPVLASARRLVELEQGSLRASLLCAALLLSSGEAEEAAGILERARQAHGPSAPLLASLSKVQAHRGNRAEALELAGEAVRLEPAHEVALGWWASLMRLAGKEAELRRELMALAQAGAWRPAIVLAELELEQGHGPAAEQAFVLALETSRGDPLCFQLTARDLRATQHHAMMVRILGSRYELREHGAASGVALAWAYLELGLPELAATLLEKLRPELTEHTLSAAADLESALARMHPFLPTDSPTALTSVPVLGPIWSGPLARLDPTLPSGSAARLVAFAPFADETKDAPAVVRGNSALQESEVAQACRSLPLVLSEAVSLSTTGTGMALILLQGTQGMASLRQRLSWEEALQLCSPSALPRVLVRGVFVRGVVSELELHLSGFEVATRAEAFSVRLRGDVVGLAQRAELEVGRNLERLGVVTSHREGDSRPAVVDAQYLHAQQQLLVWVLAAEKRLEPLRVWGAAGTLEACLALVDANPGVATPLWMLVAAFMAARASGKAEVEIYRSAVLGRLMAPASAALPRVEAFARAFGSL